MPDQIIRKSGGNTPSKMAASAEKAADKLDYLISILKNSVAFRVDDMDRRDPGRKLWSSTKQKYSKDLLNRLTQAMADTDRVRDSLKEIKARAKVYERFEEGVTFKASTEKRKTMKKTKAASNQEVNQYLKQAGILPAGASNLSEIGPNPQWAELLGSGTVTAKKKLIAFCLKEGKAKAADLVRAMPASKLPSDVYEAWQQLQAAKKNRYPSNTVGHLWAEFERLAKQAGINPMSVSAKRKKEAVAVPLPGGKRSKKGPGKRRDPELQKKEDAFNKAVDFVVKTLKGAGFKQVNRDAIFDALDEVAPD